LELFVISDTHFGHKGIIEFRREDGSLIRPFGSLEAMHDRIVREWNSVVRPGDRVYHLGDVAFGKKHLALLNRCNGRKHLIKGNHDIYPIKEYLKYFYEVSACRRFDEGILTHIPVHPDELHRFKINVHGHTHDRMIDDARYINVCVEQINYAPVPIDVVWQWAGMRSRIFETRHVDRETYRNHAMRRLIEDLDLFPDQRARADELMAAFRKGD
jgi:calcineurin-like phosphoesterase family protein